MSETTPTRPAPDRGRLVVARQVVEKIAEQAAFEVTETGTERRAFAVVPGGDPGGRVPVAAQLDGDQAWLTVDVALTYPGPLHAATEELRRHVVTRVEELAGVSVRRVDIRVGWLVDGARQPRKLS